MLNTLLAILIILTCALLTIVYVMTEGRDEEIKKIYERTGELPR